MKQKIKYVYRIDTDSIIQKMSEEGYVVKQISGTGDVDFVWILFEKDVNNFL